METQTSSPLFIKSFLEVRTFKVRISNTLPCQHLQENEIPQGSILSVTLFLVTINGIVDSLGTEIHQSLYADNFALFMSHSADDTEA